MLKYNTSLGFSPPQSLPAPDLQSPYGKYGSTHADLLKSQMMAQNADYDIAKSKGEIDYAVKQQAAERQLALQGLQQMSQAQQNQNSVANARFGMVNSLLSGLFR
jgi:hypothetical protein